jgi:hypothetical protein
MVRDEYCNINEQITKAEERTEAQRKIVASIPQDDASRREHERVLSSMQTNSESLRLVKSLEPDDPLSP